MKQKVSIFWMRRDLRLDDNAGLNHALKSGFPVIILFIFDKNILDKLNDKADKRVNFIHEQLSSIQNELIKLKSSLLVKYGSPDEIWNELFLQFDIAGIYTNHDYEPYAILRDSNIKTLAENNNINFFSFKDQCIFEKHEILSQTGNPYTVFTPYSKAWKLKLEPFYYKAYPTRLYLGNIFQTNTLSIPSLKEMGFERIETNFPQTEVEEDLIQHYADRRDFPALNATSKLSVHLRFGTISIRSLVAKALAHSEIWLNELIWRDFYMNITYHFPRVAGNAFKSKYDFIKWRNNEQEFEAWCQGKTGYPIVDAGMRELNATGFMHNRVRMIVASFLTKHLLIDWRWGEAYFAEKLLDFDFSANNGGWQWAAGSGCDAAPYFRVFNPYLQTQKFDPDLKYIKKWVPELNELSYPQPIVNHEFARKRCLEVYIVALG